MGRAFELAYFWRLDPAAVLALPLSRLDMYEAQALRIAEKIRTENDG